MHEVREPVAAKAERGRSTIEWPYFSLDEVIKLARGIFELGGSCQIDQLAGHLNQAAAGGAFRLKVQAARTFGLIKSSQGNVSLSELGARSMEPETEREARAEAFLTVPLYNALYEANKNKTLPPSSGLEGAMVNLGVAVKQKEKARQAFQRSARDAGFFTYGSTKLVYPVLSQDKAARPQQATVAPEPVTAKGTEHTPHAPTTPKGGGKGGGGDDLHPFIQGLLQTLPATDGDWPLEGRRKWLQSAVSIFDLIYQRADSADSLTVKLEKISAN